jgi:hypothetical protein
MQCHRVSESLYAAHRVSSAGQLAKSQMSFDNLCDILAVENAPEEAESHAPIASGYVSCSRPRYSWTSRIATEPSPTADATRWAAPARSSPTAKTLGKLVPNANCFASGLVDDRRDLV